MEKIKNILKNKKCLKLICGAGNENLKEVERLAFVYSSAGFNMIDLCVKPEVLTAAKRGIKRADKENDMLICISIGMQEDIHLSKAVINRQKCVLCKKCIEVCPQNAVYEDEKKIFIEEKKCIGCLKCVNICNNSAILIEHKYKAPYTMLLPLISEKIDCVEFHCSSSNEKVILEEWNKIKSIYKGCTGICLDRSKLGDDRLISLIREMGKDEKFFILQADGKPMSGGKDDYKSTLQTVAFADIIREAEIPAFLILSGGTNSKTLKLAKECDIAVDGIALGSYARKIVKQYIEKDDFFENPEVMKEAVGTAKRLADELLSDM